MKYDRFPITGTGKETDISQSLLASTPQGKLVNCYKIAIKMEGLVQVNRKRASQTGKYILPFRGDFHNGDPEYWPTL